MSVHFLNAFEISTTPGIPLSFHLLHLLVYVFHSSHHPSSSSLSLYSELELESS